MTKHAILQTRRCSLALDFSAASLVLLAILLAAGPAVFAQPNPRSAQAGFCPGDNAGITLSPGFCANIFADNLGHVRHMAFAPNGVLYVNSWSGRLLPLCPAAGRRLSCGA